MFYLLHHNMPVFGHKVAAVTVVTDVTGNLVSSNLIFDAYIQRTHYVQQLLSFITTHSVLVKYTQKNSVYILQHTLNQVEVTGFEPATFWSRTKRATKLRYTS